MGSGVNFHLGWKTSQRGETRGPGGRVQTGERLGGLHQGPGHYSAPPPPPPRMLGFLSIIPVPEEERLLCSVLPTGSTWLHEAATGLLNLKLAPWESRFYPLLQKKPSVSTSLPHPKWQWPRGSHEANTWLQIQRSKDQRHSGSPPPWLTTLTERGCVLILYHLPGCVWCPENYPKPLEMLQFRRGRGALFTAQYPMVSTSLAALKSITSQNNNNNSNSNNKNYFIARHCSKYLTC